MNIIVRNAESADIVSIEGVVARRIFERSKCSGSWGKVEEVSENGWSPYFRSLSRQ